MTRAFGWNELDSPFGTWLLGRSTDLRAVVAAREDISLVPTAVPTSD